MTFRLLPLLTTTLLALALSGCMTSRSNEILATSPVGQDALLQDWPAYALEVKAEAPIRLASSPYYIAESQKVSSELEQETRALLNGGGPSQQTPTALPVVSLKLRAKLQDGKSTYHMSPAGSFGFLTAGLVPVFDDFYFPVTAELYHNGRKLDSITYTAGASSYFSLLFPAPLLVPNSKLDFNLKAISKEMRRQALREVLLDIGAKYQLANLQSKDI